MENMEVISYWLLVASMVIMDLALLGFMIYWLIFLGGGEMIFRLFEDLFDKIKELFHRQSNY